MKSDNDDVTTYSMNRGNLDCSFKMEPQTDNNLLDFENINKYKLVVISLDSQ